MRSVLEVAQGCLLSLCLACGQEPAPATAALGSARQALSLGTVLWESQATTLPPARMGHAFIYDAVRGVSVAAGGRPVNDAGISLSDTWAWDGQSWASIAAGLPARGFIAGTFDSGRGISLSYGGLDRPMFTPQYFSQILERGTSNWVPLSGFPGLRSTTGLAYDAARSVTVLFGGFDGNNWHNDIFEWNGSFWAERCTDNVCRQVRPSVRENPVFVYDPARQVSLLFGGFGDYEALAETWTWDGSTWTQRLPPVSPSARFGCAAAYDPSTQRVFVFGGSTADGDVNELWAWDGSTWEQLQQPKGPSARRDARLVWDTARKRGVLFGGRAGTRAVDFWELSLVGNGCSSDEECHSDVCTNGVCGGAPLPEVDAGVAGTGGTSSEGTSGSGPDAGYDGEDNGSGGATSGGSAGGESPAAVSEDAGSALPEGQPEAPVVADDATHARIASDARSFYGCAMSVASDERAWRWALALGALVALRCYRRRGARSLGWTRR